MFTMQKFVYCVPKFEGFEEEEEMSDELKSFLACIMDK